MHLFTGVVSLPNYELLVNNNLRPKDRTLKIFTDIILTLYFKFQMQI